MIKVCGLREPANIRELASAGPDYMGFIFYAGSKRKAEPKTLVSTLEEIPESIQKVGVFVNEEKETILQIARFLDLDVVQLHGDEDPESGQYLRDKGLFVWKAFGIGSSHPDWQHMENWLDACDAFLFDTASAGYGGSGSLFDHEALKKYPFEHPFWLSGGIGPGFLRLPDFIRALPLLGLDINSRFETQPGVKNAGLVKTFMAHWRLSFSGSGEDPTERF